MNVIAFDNDGVLRDESVSYQRCVVETVTFFNNGIQPTQEELVESFKQSNDDWDRTHKILQQRGIDIPFNDVVNHFQDLYLGPKRDYSGYINDEPWLADNDQLDELSKKALLVIVSGAPRDEIEYTLKRNNANEYFSGIWGMHDIEDKKQGIKQVIQFYKPSSVFFCDDRPSSLTEVSSLAGKVEVVTYGILPPKPPTDTWGDELIRAGARAVFPNVKEYCKFLLSLDL